MQVTRASALLRFYRLGPERRRLLLRAWLVLSIASAAVALLPFRIAVRYGAIRLGSARLRSTADCISAVESAAVRMPWRTMCIEKGLAVQRLLRTGGVDALLHYGARHAPGSGRLEAHVWVSVAGETVLGAEDAVGYAELTVFP